MLSFLTSKPVFEESNKKLREVGHRVGGHTDEREVQKGVSAQVMGRLESGLSQGRAGVGEEGSDI